MTSVPHRHLHRASLKAGWWGRGMKIRSLQFGTIGSLQQRIGVSGHLLSGTRSPAARRQMQL